MSGYTVIWRDLESDEWCHTSCESVDRRSTPGWTTFAVDDETLVHVRNELVARVIAPRRTRREEDA